MKKILYTFGIALVLAVSGYFVASNPNIANAIESYFDRTQTATATTTVVYMGPGLASTTLTVSTWNVDKADLFIQSTASTSLSILNWKYQYSNNAVDWYDYSAYTQTSNILFTVGSTTVVSYTSGSVTASTSRIVTTFPDIASNWKRVVFTVPVGSASSSLYAEITTKRNAQ